MKITKEELNEYFDHKKFMGERIGMVTGTEKRESLSLEELDLVAAARSDRDFEAFLKEMEMRKEREDK